MKLFSKISCIQLQYYGLFYMAFHVVVQHLEKHFVLFNFWGGSSANAEFSPVQRVAG